MEMGAITAEWRTHRIYSEYWIEETQIVGDNIIYN